MGILDFLFSLIFHCVAMVMVWTTDDIRIDCGIILLQVFFLLYQIYKEN
jgi:hypothetical protein